MYLFGFIIRIYHDAQSSECQIRSLIFLCSSGIVEITSSFEEM
jgi:hypothetical protein